MEHDNSLESKKDVYRILDKFLVDNTELEELSARLSIFNIFGVLRRMGVGPKAPIKTGRR